MEWTWISAIIGFALGLVLILTGIAFRLGRTLARLTGYATRLGKPGVVIAIDGPAASGKGTLAKRIADRYRLPCLDTGLLYRAVARDVIKRGGAIDDTAAAIAAARALDPKTFGDPALRGEKAGEGSFRAARQGRPEIVFRRHGGILARAGAGARGFPAHGSAFGRARARASKVTVFRRHCTPGAEGRGATGGKRRRPAFAGTWSKGIRLFGTMLVSRPRPGDLRRSRAKAARGVP